MAEQFKLPELGENIESADVLNVLVSVGDTIGQDDPVIEVETEKAAMEVPSSVAGKIIEIHVQQGEKVKVGQPIISVEPAEGEPDTKQAAKKQKKPEQQPAGEQPTDSEKLEKSSRRVQEQELAGEAERAPAAKAQKRPPQAQRSEAEPAKPAEPAPSAEREGPAPPVAAAPSVRKFAREIGVDIHQVAGSGPGGRISVDDVKAHARQAPPAAGPAALPRAAQAEPLPDFGKWGAVEREPMGNVRKTTARHISVCWSTIPHVTVFEKADITDVEQIRQQFKKRVDQAGGKLTITAILLKVAAAALRAHPRVNASLDPQSDEVILKHYCDIGVAADTERGLVVPVVRGVDQKNIIRLAVELTELAERARAGKLTLDEMKGATFTITNLGSLGTDYFTPIVNCPEVAILGVGRARHEPVWRDGEFVPRLMLPLSLSFDHRLVDGADGARFLHWVVEALEQPMLLALEG